LPSSLSTASPKKKRQAAFGILLTRLSVSAAGANWVWRLGYSWPGYVSVLVGACGVLKNRFPQFSGHAVIPSLARDMVDPTQFDAMINWAFVRSEIHAKIFSFNTL
jgi:hypothetical protein